MYCKFAFEATADQFKGFDNADAYIKGNMEGAAYSAYTNPTVVDTAGETVNMKPAFDSYARYEKLAQTYGSYDNVESYLLNDKEAQAHIESLKNAGAGWSQNQLLYAISDAVINQESGATDTIVKDPNLKGHNITLNVNKDVGRNSDETTKIQLAGLGSRVEDLKQLANANAGSVTWNEAEGVAIINEKTPLGVQLTGTGGSLNAQAGGNVYLSGRTEGDGDVTNVLNVDSIKGGNIRLQGKDGIYNVHANRNEAAITGNNLLMQGGDGSIGTADAVMTIDVSGPVQMTAGENIYVNQVGDDALQIYSMGAGKDIVLVAQTDIVSTNTPVSSDEEEDEDGGTVLVSRYIRSDKGAISLTAGGNIGTEGQGLRVLDNGAVVNAAAQDDIYVAGVSGTGSTGTLAIGNINSAAGNASITAETNISFADDSLVSVQNGTGTLTLTAEQGSVTQGKGEEDSGIYAGTVDISSKGSQLLENANNVVTKFVVRGLDENNSLTGNVQLVSDAEAVNINFSAGGEDGLTVRDGSSDVSHTGGTGLCVTGSATTQKSEGSEERADINFHSNQGAIYVDGAMNTDDTFSASTDSGAITVTGDVTAHNGRVEATTKSGDVTIGKTDEAGVVTGDVTAENGTVNVSTSSGSVTVNGAVSSGTDTIFQAGGTEDAAGDITVNGAVHADRAVTAETTVGNIFFGGTTEAGTGITFTSNAGDISTTGSLTTAIGDVSAKTGSGAITLGGAVSATIGNVIAHSDAGAIEIKNNVTAGKDIDLNSGGKGGISVTGTATAENGKIEATTDEGDILIANKADASQDIDLSSDGGSISVTGDAEAGQDFSATTGGGNITLGGSITAETGKVLAQTGNGTLQVGGNVSSALDTELTAGAETGDEGTVIVNGAIDSGKEVHASTANGDILFKGATTAHGGDVTATVSGDGDITFNGAVTAVSNGESGGNIIANVAGNGDITTEKDALFNADEDVQFTTNDGDITTGSTVEAGRDIIFNAVGEGGMTIHKDLTAGQNVELNVNKGDIFFDGGKAGASGEDVKVTAETGDVTFTVNTEGDIKDTHREPNGDKAIISADNGSITVDHQGVGDVDLYELFAKEDAKISVADGDLYLGKVSGDLVAVLVKTEGKVMDVQHVEAATEIQISGSDMDLDDITQREDGDGFLVISPEGTSTDRPIDNFTIGNIKTNGGVRFEHLWLNNGNIHVSDGALHLDKIYVEDKATVSTDAMTTDIFGSAPVFDDSVSSAYWVNTGRNKPKDNQDVWQSEGVSDMYMYLYFDADGAVQYSNGNLLHLADHNYVYNQRYSQVDWMNIFTDKDFYNFYDRYYAPELSYHERYGLTSGDGYRVENAEEDDLVVK